MTVGLAKGVLDEAVLWTMSTSLRAAVAQSSNNYIIEVTLFSVAICMK